MSIAKEISDNLFVFILAGGSGERFWPLSRKQTPKQLLRLFSDQTLLEDTVTRLHPLLPNQQIFILTNEAQLEATQNSLSSFPSDHVIAEPAKRDTAPAAALATAIAKSQNPNAIVVLLPADHLITKEDKFRQNIADAAQLAASSEALITIAIPPTHPSSGFGYLELGEKVSTTNLATTFHQVSQFVEKPNPETAKRYFDSGNFAWNAGMFVWKASSFLKEVQQHEPELAQFIENFPSASFSDYVQKAFPTLPKNSIDYAIMEKASDVIAAKSEFEWDDVGAWDAVANHLPSDSQDNTVKGSAIQLDSARNIVFSQKRTVALCGVNDLVVVEVNDAVLVCHKDKAQDVKKLLTQLPSELL